MVNIDNGILIFGNLEGLKELGNWKNFGPKNIIDSRTFFRTFTKEEKLWNKNIILMWKKAYNNAIKVKNIFKDYRFVAFFVQPKEYHLMKIKKIWNL